MMCNPVPRRRFLQGLGTAVALPSLEAMLPASGLAAAADQPLRMGFVYVPNGVIMDAWTPDRTGHDYSLSDSLEPLHKVKTELQVLSGLKHDKAEANGDGGGDHARANATFLTGMQARKTSGKDIQLGVSVDQFAAQKMGHHTHFPSLELSCDQSRKSGSCDSGYSCAYSYNLSWSSAKTPTPAETNPRLVFERLFAGSLTREAREARARRLRYNKSILDFVMEDAKRMQASLGYADKQKLDEYLGAVREVEKQIENSEKITRELPTIDKIPSGIPSGYRDHIRIMFDLMVLAYQSDTTRVATFGMAFDGSNRSFREIGVSEGHHHLSHHKNKRDWIDKLKKVDHFYMEQFAYFLEKMRSIREGNGSLLDNAMIVYGSGISDGNRHDHDNLPVLLAGKGGGSLTPGRHVKFKGNPPMMNLYLSMLERMGAPAERLGDSTGKLSNI
jgi:hypothetical protein